MITEILNFESKEPITRCYIDKYNIVVNINVDKILYDKSCEEYIEKIKENHKDSPENLILIVVKFILPEKEEFLKAIRNRHTLSITLSKLYKIKENIKNYEISSLLEEEVNYCIKDIEDYIGGFDNWENYKKYNSNRWGFKVINPFLLIPLFVKWKEEYFEELFSGRFEYKDNPDKGNYSEYDLYEIYKKQLNKI